MNTDMVPKLEKHSIFASSDMDELASFLESKEFRLTGKSVSDQAPDARFNGVYMPGMYLGYIQYGVPVSVRATSRDEFWLQMPSTGLLEVTNGKNQIICNNARAALASPIQQDYYHVRSDENCGGVRICFYKSQLINFLEKLLGDCASQPLCFSPDLNLSSGHGLILSRFINEAVNDFDEENSTGWNEAIMTGFQELLMSVLLTSHPSNYLEKLQKSDKETSPRSIRKAIDYIHTNFATPIAMSDLIDVTGIPGRTLFRHFREFKGMTPMQYLTDLRFKNVRSQLKSPAIEESITQIALSAGFTHMGRFAAEYFRRYGEKPAHTKNQRPERTADSNLIKNE